jgi:hypothetical protein
MSDRLFQKEKKKIRRDFSIFAVLVAFGLPIFYEAFFRVLKSSSLISYANVFGIESPHTPAVSGDDDDVISWMDDQVLNIDRGQVAAKYIPFLASVFCDVDSNVCADIKDIPIRRILNDDVDRSELDIS